MAAVKPLPPEVPETASAPLAPGAAHTPGADGLPGLPPTDRSLPIALLRARERVMGPIREMLAGSRITEQQWRILRVLEEGGAMDAKRLAERACLLPPSMSRMVRSLVDRGLVARTADTADRRRARLEITPAGRAVIARNRARARALADRFEAALGPGGQAQLFELLARLERLGDGPADLDKAPRP